MNRHYKTKDYLERVRLIRKYFPLAGITTDVIVGFPTETDKEFLISKEFVKSVGFSDVHCFRIRRERARPLIKSINRLTRP